MAKFVVHVDGTRWDLDLDHELDVDLEDIDTDLAEHSALLAWWNALLAKKLSEVGEAKLRHEAAIASRELEIRNQLVVDKAVHGIDKKVNVTEGLISVVVTKDQRIQKAKLKILRDQEEVGILKAIVRGFDGRGVILATVGGKRRAEVESSLRETIRKTKKGMRGGRGYKTDV